MSEYRRALQDALIARRRAGGCPPYRRFYTVCEYAACAAMTAGWAFTILCHLVVTP